MSLTAQDVKRAALEAGAGDVGIGNIARWDNAPRMMHPNPATGIFTSNRDSYRQNTPSVWGLKSRNFNR